MASILKNSNRSKIIVNRTMFGFHFMDVGRRRRVLITFSKQYMLLKKKDVILNASLPVPEVSGYLRGQ